MAVYVDSARIPYGRMVMCHLLADTTEELVEMAGNIGVHRRWIQKAGTPEEHFDICLAKRAEAVRLGAEEVDGRQLVRLIQQRRRAFAAPRGATQEGEGS